MPEIARADLSEALLALGGVGVSDARSLGWLTPPPDAALTAAQELLQWLGATNANGELSEQGRRLLICRSIRASAAVVTRGEELGVASEACLAAALLSERDYPQRRAPPHGSGRTSRSRRERTVRRARADESLRRSRGPSTFGPTA